MFSVFACQTCTRVFFDLCFQPRGATLAPPELSTPPTLLGQQVKAEYTYSVPPPPPPTPHHSLSRPWKTFTLPFVFVCFFQFSFSAPRFILLFFFQSIFELLFLLRTSSQPRRGIACFRPFSCQSSFTILHVDLLTFFPPPPLFSRRRSSSARASTPSPMFLFFVLIFPSIPVYLFCQWRLQHHLTCHCITSQVLLLRDIACVCVYVSV